jgi:hypothetical protein
MTDHQPENTETEPEEPVKLADRRFDPWERVRRLNAYVEKSRQEARDRAKVSTEIWDGVDRNYFHEL